MALQGVIVPVLLLGVSAWVEAGCRGGEGCHHCISDEGDRLALGRPVIAGQGGYVSAERIEQLEGVAECGCPAGSDRGDSKPLHQGVTGS
ncbi:MAG: hypothetical protein AAFY26_13980 [Cyanobacteria bacterium J06638_22]